MVTWSRPSAKSAGRQRYGNQATAVLSLVEVEQRKFCTIGSQDAWEDIRLDSSRVQDEHCGENLSYVPTYSRAFLTHSKAYAACSKRPDR
jgi:hypothetical protein